MNCLGRHVLMDGFGGMGDALVCVKCGYDRYPESIPPFVRFISTQIPNEHRNIHCNDFPYVRRYREPCFTHEMLIPWEDEKTLYIGYYGRDGKYHEGKYHEPEGECDGNVAY